ncbi:MAG: hypothetical protein GY782_05550 [Gammaproteobacteria bacterium]|nr:hypothetical protein [Gammaproteobacteria bacterium]
MELYEENGIDKQTAIKNSLDNLCKSYNFYKKSNKKTKSSDIEDVRKRVLGIVKSEVRQSHSIFLRMFFENIQPVTRHYGAPWGAY